MITHANPCGDVKTWMVWTCHLFGFLVYLFKLLSTHADRQGVDISFTVCLSLFCVFVWIRISPPRIKLAASHFDRRPRQGITNFCELCSPRTGQKPKIGRTGQRTCHSRPHVNITVEVRRPKRHARDAPFVIARVDVGSAYVDVTC